MSQYMVCLLLSTIPDLQISFDLVVECDLSCIIKRIGLVGEPRLDFAAGDLDLLEQRRRVPHQVHVLLKFRLIHLFHRMVDWKAPSLFAWTTFLTRELGPAVQRRSLRCRRLDKSHRSRICKFNLITERMFGNPRDDGRRNVVQIVSGVRIAHEYDLKTSSEGASNRCTDTHLGQQAGYGNASHTLLTSIVVGNYTPT